MRLNASLQNEFTSTLRTMVDDTCMMDVAFEHTLDMEDLCRQMDRSQIICTDSNRDDIIAAVRATRYYLRCESLPVSDAWYHLLSRVNVYDTYMSLVRFSPKLQFLVKSMQEFQLAYKNAQDCDDCDDMQLKTLLRLAYFIDREICYCAAVDE